MDRLAITIQSRDVARHIALARKYQVGIEVQIYGYNPDLMDHDGQVLLKQHKSLLRDFEGEIAFHGAFYDMNGASLDSEVIALTRRRYLSSLRTASQLGARNVIFHANYLPHIHHPSYLPEWTRRQIAFWEDVAQEAQKLNVIIALENMWEPEPGIIARVLEQVRSPHLKACLDVGHVYLYSDALPLSAWVERMRDWLVHCHINNNQGLYDEHMPLDAPGGVIDYSTVLPMLRSLPQPPLISLEMEHLEDLERSLRYLTR